MKKQELPSEIDRFCKRCGTELSYTNLQIRQDPRSRRGAAKIRCPRCGWQISTTWARESIPVDPSKRDSEGRIKLGPVSSPALVINDKGLSSYSIFDDPPAAPPGNPPALDVFMQQSIEISGRIARRGVSALLDVAPFPVYGLSGLSPRLRGSLLMWDSAPVSVVHLQYAPPDKRVFDELVWLVCADTKKPSGMPDALAAQLAEEGKAGFMGGVVCRMPQFRHLRDGGAIYQVINVEVVDEAPMSRVRAELGSGEECAWEVRHLNNPVAVTYCESRIGRTSVQIAAAGPIAAEIGGMLDQVIRLERGSAEVAELDVAFTNRG